MIFRVQKYYIIGRKTKMGKEFFEALKALEEEKNIKDTKAKEVKEFNDETNN